MLACSRALLVIDCRLLPLPFFPSLPLSLPHFLSHPPPRAAPSQAPDKIMWNTSNSKVILKWDQVHALENESEVTGYKVKLRLSLLPSLHCHVADDGVDRLPAER